MTGRRLRELSVVLGLLLMVMLGAIIVVFVSQPGLRSSATATPTLVGGATSPVATTSAPTAGATASPATIGPTGGATPTAGEATASPTAQPPGAPAREIAFFDLGLDTTDTGGEEEPLARFFTFTVDGPGHIEATLSDVSFGRVRMCLGQGDPTTVSDNECQTVRRGALGRDVTVAGPTTWTVSLIGSQAGASPTVTLALSWPTNDARMHISSFRFQGQEIQNYNGFVAEVEVAADGFIDISATFDDGAGGAYPYRLIIEEVGGGPAQAYIAEGEGSELNTGSEVSAGRRYRITLASRQAVADQRVLLTADLSWP